MQTFKDWLANQDESSAFTRRRHAAALGLAPPIPAASVHSRSTASPFETEKLTKKSKKKKKKKCTCDGKCDDCKNKNKKKKVDESRKRGIVKNNRIDDFLNAVGALKDDARSLEDAKAKRSKEDRDASRSSASKSSNRNKNCKKKPNQNDDK